MPDGFRIETSERPSPAQLNSLLQACGESTHDEQRWLLALERSVWHLSILDSSSGELVGFVRATSDLALNANLWNLCARPGAHQDQLLAVLVHRSLHMLRRDLPGCSLSISAPANTVEALEKQGFVIDPTGIRAMGLRMQSP